MRRFVDDFTEERTAKINYTFVNDFCFTFSLIILVKEFTCIDKVNGFTSKAALTHIFTNIPGSCINIIEPYAFNIL